MAGNAGGTHFGKAKAFVRHREVSIWRRGATTGIAFVPSKETGESIDLYDPSDVEDMNTKRY